MSSYMAGGAVKHPFKSERGTFHISEPQIPLYPTDIGVPGEIGWDENFIYVYVGSEWKRLPLQQWTDWVPIPDRSSLPNIEQPKPPPPPTGVIAALILLGQSLTFAIRRVPVWIASSLGLLLHKRG